MAGDVWDGTQWRTIVVGGVNAGGRGYYALDITSIWAWRRRRCGIQAQDRPLGPVPLPVAGGDAGQASTADCNLGSTFGKPIITKLQPTPGS